MVAMFEVKISAVHSIIREKLSELCRQEPAVTAAYLFGSFGKGGSPRPTSDVDVALLLNEKESASSCPLTFAVSLEKACDRRIDMVILNRAGELLKREVRRTGIVVFERDARARKRFEVMGRKTYEDFLHLHQRYVQAVLYRDRNRQDPEKPSSESSADKS